MRIETADSWPVSIFIAGDYYEAWKLCREYCDEIGLCVTLTSTTYIYTGGDEPGLIVGLINYPRFPKKAAEIGKLATDLGYKLCEGLGQESFSIQTPAVTVWFSGRDADLALAAATGTAKTAEQAECEASQSGGSASERNAQTQSSTPDNKDKPNA